MTRSFTERRTNPPVLPPSPDAVILLPDAPMIGVWDGSTTVTVTRQEAERLIGAAETVEEMEPLEINGRRYGLRLCSQDAHGYERVEWLEVRRDD